MSKADLITFDDKQQTFHLHNDYISYVLGIEEGGVLAHLYYGQRINHYHGQLKNPRLDRGFSGNLPSSDDRTYSLDAILREYSSAGDSDYRVPSMIVRQSDGSRSAMFTYDQHTIMMGKPKLEGLPAAYTQTDDEAQTLVIELVDKVSQLKLALSYTIYRNRPVITRSVQVINKGVEDVRLEKIASMAIDLPAGDKQVISLPGSHVNERHVDRQDISFGTKVFQSRRGTTSHHMNNFIALVDRQTTEQQGSAIGLSLVYSGNHKEEVSKDPFGTYRINMGINDDQFDWLLAPNESFQAPEVIMTYSNTGLNGMSQALADLLQNRVARGKHQKALRPIVVNNWEATFMDFDEERLQPLVDEAKDMGLEMFVLDDGWFGHRDNDDSSLGDWQVYQQKFPKGLQHFSDYIHQEGLKFGIWFEPEMISIDSDLYRQHPEYMLRVPNREPSPARSQFVLDMGRKEVRENIHQQMRQVLDNCPIDYIKWDMNRNLSDIYSNDLPADQQGEVMHRYVLGLYELLEELTTEYPDILWEGCSGGGGRFDTGMLYYIPQSWTSDNTDAVARMQIQYGTSLAYPISSMTSHVSVSPNQQTGRFTSLETRGAVAMSGVFGYELDLTQMTEDEKQAVKEQIAFYKEIRPIIQYGKFSRLLNPEETNYAALMFVSEDQQDVVAFSFKILSEAQPAYHVLKLTGLMPNKDYQNVETGQIIGGDELMNTGFYEEVSFEDFASKIYRFKMVTD